MLFEIVKRFQANGELDDEYLRLVAGGGGGARLDEILAERRANAEVIGRLLAQLET